MCVFVSICARVRAGMRACVSACACVRAIPSDCNYARVCAAALCAPSHRTAAACGIYSSARAARCGRARAVAFGATGRARARSAAGVTWTCRTASAPWAGRAQHTTVVDAVSGAIYVIGGRDGSGTVLSDVWASTDGGVRPDSVAGRSGGSGGTTGYYGFSRVLHGGTVWVLLGY